MVEWTQGRIGSGQIWVLCGCLLVGQFFQVTRNVHNKMLGGNPVVRLYVKGFELNL